MLIYLLVSNDAKAQRRKARADNNKHLKGSESFASTNFCGHNF